MSWALLLQSLENEAILDCTVAKGHLSKAEMQGLPAFKQLKLVPLRQKLCGMFMPALYAAALLGPLKALMSMFYWLLFRSLSGTGHVPANACVYFRFYERHHVLLKQVIEVEHGTKLDGLTRRQAVALLTPREIWWGVKAVCGVYKAILKKPRKQRFALLLHCYDLDDLALVMVFAQRYPDQPIGTSSILQRWAFIMNHTSDNVWMVQHGYVYPGVDLPYPFRKVAKIFAYSQEQFNEYARYYKARENHLIASQLDLKDVENSQGALFLASSAPYIDAEISVLSALKGQLTAPIAIKLHPNHSYGPQAEVLLGMADIVIPADVNPTCKVILSHSSFYGVMYERKGIPNIAFANIETHEELSARLEAAGVIQI